MERKTLNIPAYLKSHWIELELKEPLSQSVQDYVARCREKVEGNLSKGLKPKQQLLLLSRLMDQLVLRLFEQVQNKSGKKPDLALFAQGGYGREELNLYSDLDLFFLTSDGAKESYKSFIQSMLYPLWDAKVPVGYSLRSLKESVQVMEQDVRAKSSLLDARFLMGDNALKEKFESFLKKTFSKNRVLKKFIKEKELENVARLKKFGASVYVTEPNIKESEGGLRDWHTLQVYLKAKTGFNTLEDWVRLGELSDDEADKISRALDFLWLLRNHLHSLSQKSQDQISFENQKKMAKLMGFEDDETSLGVEKFMRRYYGHASELLRMRREVVRRILSPPRGFWTVFKNRFRKSLAKNLINQSGKVLPKYYRDLKNHPLRALQAFYLAQKKGLSLHEDFKAWINQHLELFDQEFQNHPQTKQVLRQILTHLDGVGDSLWHMHDCRLLGVLLPEFEIILHQTQHDAYHVYTVDTHLIKAVQELSALSKGDYGKEFKTYAQALSEVQSPTALILGTLCHDIGKGQGKGHSERGAVIARNLMERLEFDQEEIQTVEFLVLSHLTMSHLSQRRDLEDPNLVSQFAKALGSLERLNLLFLLTWADIRAVGPEVWTPWKGALLEELYHKTRQRLLKGAIEPERALKIREERLKEILKTRPKRLGEAALKQFLNSMPPRYFLANESGAILQHFDWISQSEDKSFVLAQSMDAQGDYHEVMLFTVHSPRLLERTFGVFAANQLNILAVEQNLNNQGEALLQLRLSAKKGRRLLEEARFEKLKKDLQDIIQGKINLEKYYEARKPRYGLRSKPSKPPRVDFDNDVSPYYTVIDIYADDRLGLLYELTRLLRQQGLFVELSKITTKADQVSDSFYVKDIFGHKLKDKQKMKDLKEVIMGLVGGE